MISLGRLLRRPFPVVFGALLVAAFVVALGHRMGPGQDFHYHTMAARIAARTWIGDPAYASLYAKVNPLDANTLFYVLAFPFELVLAPLDAMRAASCLVYFVGYPALCALALRFLDRSPWGAVVAVPLAYDGAWVGGGFLPFCTSAGLLVLTVALLTRALEGRASSRQLVGAAVIALLLFFAHAHVFAWTMVLFGTFTAVTILGRLALGVARGMESAARDAARTAARMLAVVGPALVLFAWWWLRMRRLAPPAAMRLSDDDFHVRISRVHTLLALTKDRSEFLFIGLFAVLALGAMMLAGRPKRESSRLPELAFLASAATYVLLPWAVNDQGIAPRQFEMAMWLLPLVIYPHAPRGTGAALRHGAIAAALVVFSGARLREVGEHLRALDVEYTGLFELAKRCPPSLGRDGRRAELAYATNDMFTGEFFAATFHQSFESFAITCGLDAPVYDTAKYPYNLVPLRYARGTPAPPTMIVGDEKWFERPGLWAAFEYVLVRGLPPPPADLAEVLSSSGEWALYRRK